jgi:hypothetical protein
MRPQAQKRAAADEERRRAHKAALSGRRASAPAAVSVPGEAAATPGPSGSSSGPQGSGPRLRNGGVAHGGGVAC